MNFNGSTSRIADHSTNNSSKENKMKRINTTAVDNMQHPIATGEDTMKYYSTLLGFFLRGKKNPTSSPIGGGHKDTKVIEMTPMYMMSVDEQPYGGSRIRHLMRLVVKSVLVLGALAMASYGTYQHYSTSSTGITMCSKTGESVVQDEPEVPAHQTHGIKFSIVQAKKTEKVLSTKASAEWHRKMYEDKEAVGGHPLMMSEKMKPMAKLTAMQTANAWSKDDGLTECYSIQEGVRRTIAVRLKNCTGYSLPTSDDLRMVGESADDMVVENGDIESVGSVKMIKNN